MTAYFRRYTIFLVTWGMLFFGGNILFAQDVRITDIVVTNTKTDLVLKHVKIEGAFTKTMEDAILSGVPTSFSFIINLTRSRQFLTDKTILDVVITHTVKYDNLKKQFLITRSWKPNSPLMVDTLEHAEEIMTSIRDFKVIPLSSLIKGHRYELRTKAELSRVTLPFYLHYILVFVSLWDFETEWYSISFTY